MMECKSINIEVGVGKLWNVRASILRWVREMM